MTDPEVLQEEINQYKKEKEAVRKIIGQIGGNRTGKKERIVNVLFMTLVLVLFTFDLMRYALDLHINFIPEMFSIEIAILLVSLKIIWMINEQQKVDHFQFWILNTIEFQINSTAVRIRKIEKALERMNEKET